MRAVEAVQRFFSEERDEQLGMIAADAVLEFFLTTIGLDLYRKGVEDAKRWIADKLEDMEIDVRRES